MFHTIAMLIIIIVYCYNAQVSYLIIRVSCVIDIMSCSTNKLVVLQVVLLYFLKFSFYFSYSLVWPIFLIMKPSKRVG